MNRLHRVVAYAMLLSLVSKSASLAVTGTTLTMDDLPTQPVNGLVHPAGVTFGFTIGRVGSTDAQYNSFGPGTLTFVDDPSIEGNAAGVLSMQFTPPMPMIEFGVARSIMDALPNGVAVERFDGSNTSLGSISLMLNPLPTFAEAKFSHVGVPLSRLLVSFPSPNNAPRFALDNLTFQIPEPPTQWLIAPLGLLALCSVIRRVGLRQPRSH